MTATATELTNARGEACISGNEAAKRLGLSRQRVHQLVRRGVFPGAERASFVNLTLIPVAAVESLIVARKLAKRRGRRIAVGSVRAR